MRSVLALAAASVSLTVGAASYAEEPTSEGRRVRFTLRPEVGLQGGTEVSELTASVSGISVRSTLTYPVDVVLVGARASIGFGVVELASSFHHSVTNPAGKMLDQDFIQGIELSHTESRTEAKLWVLELAARVRVAELGDTPGRMPFSLIGGFRHASNAFDVYGLSGVQRPDGVTTVPVSLPDSVHGLHYESRYEIPFVGGRIDGKVSDAVTISGEARALSAWSSHVDDHLLRHKLGEASMQAFGGSLLAELRWDVGSTVFVGALGELQVLHGSGGTLKQHFYADDPGTTAVETPATPIIDAQYSYKSDRYRLFAFAGLAF